MWVNRRTAIAKSATNLGDVVLTTPEIAKATPDYPGIIPMTATPKQIDTAKAAVADANELKRKD